MLQKQEHWKIFQNWLKSSGLFVPLTPFCPFKTESLWATSILFRISWLKLRYSLKANNPLESNLELTTKSTGLFVLLSSFALLTECLCRPQVFCLGFPCLKLRFHLKANRTWEQLRIKSFLDYFHTCMISWSLHFIIAHVSILQEKCLFLPLQPI